MFGRKRKIKSIWSDKIKEYESIDRKSPNAKKLLDEKFYEIFQIVYKYLNDHEKKKAREILQSVRRIRNIEKLDKEYKKLIKLGEKYVFSSGLQKAWREIIIKYRQIPNAMYSSLRGEDYLKLFKEKVRERIKPEIPKLDIGCSDGNITKIFDKEFKNVIGLDVRIPEKRANSLSIVKGDGCHLPFSNDAFNLIICLNIIEHISNPYLLIKECARCLREGGLLYIVYPNKFFPVEAHTAIPFITYLPKHLQNILCKFLTGFEFEFYVHHLSFRELENILIKNGFEVIDAGGFIYGDYLFPGILNLLHKFLKAINFYRFCPHTLYIICKKT